jgi:hypothetical protein
LLESPKEKQHIKPQRTTIDWKAFAKRWVYYCRIQKCQGNSTYCIQIEVQLKRKEKIEMARQKKPK